MNARRSTGLCAFLLTALGLVAASAAEAQLQWTSKDEKTSFKVGLLGQLQAEQAEVPGTDDDANNLFLRRLRVIMGFNLGEKLSVFLETDSPNLGKGANNGTKDAGDMFIQDFVATWKFSQAFHLDGGLLLTEQTYNHNQSAASLLTLDYGPYSFVESGPTQARVGRDYGLRARGYVLDNHLEYRLGVYQGVRGPNASNDFRYIGRAMYSFFTPQTGLFYRGTSLGKTQTLSIGASFDTQEEYENIGLDLFYDQPFGGGNSFVVQVDYADIDGDTFLTTLPKRTNLLVETGVYIAKAKLQPFVQYASQDLDASGAVDEDRFTVGLAYFQTGHNNNLKFSYTRIERDPGDSFDQINLQWQIFQF